MTYLPVNTSISLPLATIQKLATSKTVLPSTTKEIDCTKKPILNHHTPKITSQKTEVKRWLFSKNRKIEISKKNTENQSPRSQKIPSSSSGAKGKFEAAAEKKTRRFIGINAANVTFRRGQTSNKLDGQIHTPESLSRSSSVTNLHAADQQTTPKVKGGGTKPRKSASRDKLDKIGSGTGTTDRKNERKGVTKNNNKFDSGDTALALDSLQEIESLRAQLHQMATEKSNLALELGEQKGHINSLQHQIENLKMYQEQSNLQLEQLTEENTALRNRLRDVAHSPLSDNEKQQLLYESHRHHNSAPASIATNPLDDGTCGDVTACPTPDWDKHSSSNVSEVSVACLQDKINQMQETHYSTNEELQATLQELTDLQKQLTELQQENERLSEEKNLMFDSLCRQTERLKDTRQEVESLKTLLYREKNEPGVESAQEREEKLVDLLKSAQDEHESLLSKHEQMSVELRELRDANDTLHEELKVLTDRNVTLESTLDAKHAEHKLLDQELALAKDQSSGRQIEINRLKDLLENARTKIVELEQDRALSDKSELDELLDNARKEKDSLESEVAHLKDQLARSKNEIEKLKEQVSILQEECKVTRNNAKTIQSDLEYKCEKLVSDKTLLTEQLHNFQDAINELQVQAQCQVEDKRNLSDVLAETQRNLSESERRIISLQNELADVKKLRKDENEEWEKFQNDLLTSVRVANDFKTEAQQDLQKMIMENKEHRDKVRQLEAQLDKLKGESTGSDDQRRSSQPFVKQHEQRRIFGSLPNILDGCGSDRDPRKTKRAKGAAHQKQMSLEEGKILDTLDKMYKEIDPNAPEDQLTTEQVVVRRLKTLYEDQSSSYRPVAPRNKGDLAISKPLLESVYSNPKLETIAKNPDLRCLETDRFSWLGHKKFTDDEIPEETTRIPSVREDETRCTLLPNEEFQLKRYSSKEDLSDLFEDEEDIHKSLRSKIAKKRSSLKSTNSETSSNYSRKKKVSFDEKRNSCFLIKEFLSYESLEDIYRSIDPKIPERQLTKEQRFAVRVKMSGYNLGEKPELRKRPTFKKKKVTISWPTKESVLRNTKLRSIMNDPIIMTVGEGAEERETVELRNLKRMRKYLADTNVVLRNSRQENSRTNLCKNDPRLSVSLEDIGSRVPFVFDRPFSSMENLPSERADRRGQTYVQTAVTTNVLPAKSFASSFVFSSSSSSVDNSVEPTEDTPVVFIEHFEPEEVEVRENHGVQIREMSVDSAFRNWQFIDEEGNTDLVEGTEDAPTVVFVEHFEPVGVEMRGNHGVQIREMSVNNTFRNSQLTDEEGYTGRISFPDDYEAVHGKTDTRVSSFGCVEMDEMYDEESLREKHTSDRISEAEVRNDDEKTEKYDESSESARVKTTEENRYISGDIPWNNEVFQAKYIKFSIGDTFDGPEASGYSPNRTSNVSCESWEGEERKQVKARYGEVVQEIKHRYSLRSPSVNSDDDDINIFSPGDGTIEVRKLSKEDDAGKDPYLDTFFHPSGGITSHEKDNLGAKYVEQIADSNNSSVLLQEKEFIRYVRQVYEEDFKDIDVLGYVSDEGLKLNNEEGDQKSNSRSVDISSLPSTNSDVRESAELHPLIISTIDSEDSVCDVVDQNETSIGVDNNSSIPSESRMVVSDFDEYSKFVEHTEKMHSEIDSKEVAEFSCDILECSQNYDSKTSQEITIGEGMNERSSSWIYLGETEAKSSKYIQDEILASKNRCYEANIVEKDTGSANLKEEKYGTEFLRHLSTSEVDLVSSLNKRNSRPISAINMDDIAFIEAMKNKYLIGDKLEGTDHPDVSSDSEHFDTSHTVATSTFGVDFIERDKNDFENIHESPDNDGDISEIINQFLMNERKVHPPSLKIENSTSTDFLSERKNPGMSLVEKTDALDMSPQFVSKKELIITSARNSFESRNSSIFTRTGGNVTGVHSSISKDKLDRSSLERVPYEPVYENYYEMRKRQLQNFDNAQRKPKPLPRNLRVASAGKLDKPATRKNNTNAVSETAPSMKLETRDSVNYVKVESENHEPNYSKVMDRTDDIIGMETKTDKVVDRCLISFLNTTKRLESPSKTDIGLEESTSEYVTDTRSSNILVRKTKKFIKDGDQMEEFDETTVGVSNVELENLPDKDRQLIPEDLIDYADSESKITMFNNDSKEGNEYFEPCSRPQTSRQASTPFRLSCYAEDSIESIGGTNDDSPRKSSDSVARLKERFENLAGEINDSKRNSVISRGEYVESRRSSNLPKLFKEKDTYDLVFKTNSKYWFDNNSELERSDATIHRQSTPNFEPSTSTTPLNITILDPVESKTNTNYQHLFESDPTLGGKPFVANAVRLSELNLKTSIPCVDFTTLPTIEKESNASLYDFGLESEAGKSDCETFGRFGTRKKPT